MHWQDIPIHVIDFEGSRASGVIEYGVVTLRGGKVTECATRLCRPMEEIALIEQRQHGIRAADANDTAPFTDEWERFVALRKSGPLAAHHATVESHFLKQSWPYPPESPDFLHAENTVADWGPWLDTRQLYAQVYPDLNSHALGELIATFALQPELNALAAAHCPAKRSKYHCALYDALASALLIQHLGRQADFAQVSLAWLLRHSQSSASKRNAAQQGDLF